MSLFFLPFIQCWYIMDILILVLEVGESGLDYVSSSLPSNSIAPFSFILGSVAMAMLYNNTMSHGEKTNSFLLVPCGLCECVVQVFRNGVKRNRSV